jgi:hypothetical protein
MILHDNAHTLLHSKIEELESIIQRSRASMKPEQLSFYQDIVDVMKHAFNCILEYHLTYSRYQMEAAGTLCAIEYNDSLMREIQRLKAMGAEVPAPQPVDISGENYLAQDWTEASRMLMEKVATLNALIEKSRHKGAKTEALVFYQQIVKVMVFSVKSLSELDKACRKWLNAIEYSRWLYAKGRSLRAALNQAYLHMARDNKEPRLAFLFDPGRYATRELQHDGKTVRIKSLTLKPQPN